MRRLGQMLVLLLAGVMVFGAGFALGRLGDQTTSERTATPDASTELQWTSQVDYGVAGPAYDRLSRDARTTLRQANPWTHDLLIGDSAEARYLLQRPAAPPVSLWWFDTAYAQFRLVSEQVDLTTPETKPANTAYTVESLTIHWRARTLSIGLVSNAGESKTVTYTGDVASALINALNKANLSVKSLHRRILERLVLDGHLKGAVSGVPD